MRLGTRDGVFLDFSGFLHNSPKSCGDTPQIKCLCTWVCGLLRGGHEGRCRVEVSFSGQKIWSKIGSRKGGREKRGWHKVPLGEEERSNFYFRVLFLVQDFLSKMFCLFFS